MTAEEHRAQRARVVGSLLVDEQREHRHDAPTPRHRFQQPVVRELNPPDSRIIPGTCRAV